MPTRGGAERLTKRSPSDGARDATRTEAQVSDDLQRWRDVTGKVSSPTGYKHGTPLLLPPAARRAVCDARRGAGPFSKTEVCAASPPSAAAKAKAKAKQKKKAE